MSRYARRIDTFQTEAVEAFRARGWGVVVCSQVGGGFPDLLVHGDERMGLVELIGDAKAAKYRASGGLTPDQVKFRDAWRGPAIVYARTIPEALRWW